jgi:hypothetical protein
MISLRTVVVSLLSFAVAAFALPAIAGNKSFVLKADSPVAIGQQIKVSFTNSDDGNSSFNSVSVTAAPGPGTTLTITDALQSGSQKPGKPVISGNRVVFTDLSPIKTGQTLTVTLTVSATTAACSSGSIQWTGEAWTGSPSTPSNPFSTTDSPITTLSARACGISFDVPPKSALVNQLITGTELNPAGAKVKVRVTINGSPAPNGTPVALSSSCTAGSLTLAGGNGQTSSGSVEFSSLKSSTTGNGCKLTATTTALDPSKYFAMSTPNFGVVDAKLVVAPAPTSFALNVSTPLTAQLVTADTNTLVPQTGSGTMTVSSACTPTTLTANTATGVLSFAGVSGVTAGGTCSLTVSATFAGATYTSATYGPYTVFASGNLKCDLNTTLPDPPVANTTSYFSALPVGVTSALSVTDVGYAAGYRARNDKDTLCPPTNYTFTNNIKGGNSTDAAGNTLPDNAVSFVWDQTSQPEAVFTYTLTFAPEFADDISGLPTKKRTLFCRLKTEIDPVTNKPVPLPTNCADRDFQAPLKACLGTALNSLSIPGDDPACIAREEWTTLPPGSCGTYTGSAQDAPACIRVTNRIIDARDPPIIRGDF